MENLTAPARKVLRNRYLRRDENGTVVESPRGMFRRVASNLSRVEQEFDGNPEAVEERFFKRMSRLEFLPNSPTLMNAETPLQQLAACFVLPLEDSIESIFTTLRQTALIHQSGGGTGFSFSRLRPRGDPVKETGGIASGPVSFMKVFDSATEQIKQGGRRRGANMAVLHVSHPDIQSFIDSKRTEGVLRNFNLSVSTSGSFWDALEQGRPFPLVNPRTGNPVERVDPARVLRDIARSAWECGDPGMLFRDRINRDNPTPFLGSIEATNPCGEVPLLPYEACVLGSVNLGSMTRGSGVHWDKLRGVVHDGVRLLDNAIEASRFPLPEIDRIVSRNRKIGLGVMGFHDMLVDLNIPYDTAEAVEFADELMSFIHREARTASRRLAENRGPFPHWKKSTHDRKIRNATITSIAPTGTISLIAGCSSGIEPIYNVVYNKQVMGGLRIVNDRFQHIARERDFYTEGLMERVEKRTSLQDLSEIPEDVKRLFQTAHDVPASRHVDIQAAFQRHVDNAVSKTVNLRRSAAPGDVLQIYKRARRMDLKGITVFRSGSRREQVLGTDPLKEECISECDYIGTP